MEDKAQAEMAPGDELVGATLGERYKIIKQINRGGMGIVFLGRHVVLDSLLAIKVLLRQRNQIDQQRFLLEAKLASKISHPNTVNIVDFGTLPGGRSYLVMEYLKGETLDEVLKHGRLTPTRACRIFAQIARGLQAVHDKGIIHRGLSLRRRRRKNPPVGGQGTIADLCSLPHAAKRGSPGPGRLVS